MNVSQGDYLLALQQESARSLAHYQLGGSSLTPTETIEFHLLHHCLTTRDGQDVHLALDGDSTDIAFLARLLDTIVLANFHRNWIDSQQLPSPRVRAGDMLFHKDKVFCCAEVYPDGKWTVREAFKKNASPYSAPIKKAIVLLRKENYTYQTRRTAGQLIEYRDYFRNALNEPKLELLSQFTHKILLIGHKDLLNERPAYPVRYWSREGTLRAHGLPIDTMVEACGSVETALTYILVGDVYFDEVILVGSERYKKTSQLDNLRNEKNLGRIGKLILIGGETPDLGNQPIKSWRWTAPELKHLQQKPEANYRIEKLTEPALLALIDALGEAVSTLREQTSVDASELLFFIRFYYRLFMPSGPRRDEIIMDYSTRLEGYLQSEKLLDKFSIAEYYDLDEVATHLQPIRLILNSVRDYFLLANPKYEQYQAASMATARQPEAIVLPAAKYASEIPPRERGQLLTYGGQAQHGIPNLLTWARSSANTSKRICYVPGWKGKEGLLQVWHLSGNVVFYLFDGIETDTFSTDWEHALAYEQRWQQHADRNYWFTARPPLPERRVVTPIAPETTSASVDMADADALEPEQLIAALGPKAFKYKLQFTDGTADDFYGYKAIWILRNGTRTDVTVAELQAGAKVLFYQNKNKAVFNQIIRQRAGDEKIQRIEAQRQCWRDYCRVLFEYYQRDLDRLHTSLKQCGMSARIEHLRAYLRPESTIQFPQKRTTNAMFKLGNALGLSQHPFITNYKAVVACRKLDRNLRHSTGKQLSDELMHFEQTHMKRALLSQLDDEIVDELINSIQEKTIASITLLTNGKTR